jgi:hypothetical protein
MMKLVTISVRGLVVVAALAAVMAAPADEPKGEAKADNKLVNKLVGTWKLVRANYDGKNYTLPKGHTKLKHVTPTHFMWAVYGEDGKVTASLGGTYTFKDDEYIEMPEYGTEGFERAKANFKCQFRGNNANIAGGLISTRKTFAEVWERVEKK